MRVASAIELDEARREELVKLAHSNTAEVRLARRAASLGRNLNAAPCPSVRSSLWRH